MTTDNLELHPRTRAQVEIIAARPAQGYLFVGQAGSGRYELAGRLAKEWAKGDTSLIQTAEPDGNSIGIDAIHGLRALFAQKVSADVRRTVIFREAQLLTREAQNSLLKALEEPPARTTFILTAAQASDVLPTIASRLQIVTFYPLREEYLVQWFSKTQQTSPEDALRLFYLGGRTPGGMIAAKADSNEIMDLAKKFATQDQYQKVVVAAQLQKAQRPELIVFIDSLAQLFELALHRAAQQSDTKQAKTINQRLELLLESRDNLEGNVNPRLVLSRLVVNL